MNRRTALFVVTILMAGGAMGVQGHVSAQTKEQIVDYALNEANWSEPQDLLRHQHLSEVFAKLRIVYNGPHGYEAERSFMKGITAVLNGVSGEAPLQTINSVQQALHGNLKVEIEEHLRNTWHENGKQASDWLAEIGIADDLALELLRAQAVFSVFGTVNLGDGNMNFADGLTWVYPFCHSPPEQLP